jgi:vitamin B12 transporter
MVRAPSAATPFVRAALAAIFIALLAAVAHAQGPAPDTELNADEIKAMKARSVQDILNRLPGVSAGDTTAAIDGSREVLVYLDGVSITDPNFGPGSVPWPLVPLRRMEKIVVHHNAADEENVQPGGVIYISTRDPRRPSGNAEISAGNFAARAYRGEIKGTVNDLTLGASGSYEAGDGYRENDDREIQQARAYLRAKINDSFRLEPEFSYGRERRGLPGFVDAPTPRARRESDAYSGALTVAGDQLQSQITYRDETRRNFDPAQAFDQRLRLKTAAEELGGHQDLAPGAKLEFAAGYEYAEVRVLNGPRTSESRGWGLLRTEIEPPDAPLRLTLGLRGDGFSAFEDVLNPEAKIRFGSGLAYLECAYRQDHLVPTLSQRYERTSEQIPNPKLQMEKSATYSVTVVSDVYDSPRLSLSLFQSEIKDAIVYARGPAAAGQFINAPRVIIRGLELEGDGRIADGLFLQASYTYKEAADLHRDTWLPAVPRHQARIKIDYLPVPDLKLSVTSQYLSPQFTRRDNSTFIPDSYLTGLRAEYSPGPLTLYAAIDNLLDRRYQSSYGYLAPPFTWTAGLKYEW